MGETFESWDTWKAYCNRFGVQEDRKITIPSISLALAVERSYKTMDFLNFLGEVYCSQGMYTDAAVLFAHLFEYEPARSLESFADFESTPQGATLRKDFAFQRRPFIVNTFEAILPLMFPSYETILTAVNKMKKKKTGVSKC